jgi:hypothetical protein
MEPRLFSHGDLIYIVYQQLHSLVVSMEPRLFSHGDGGHFSAFTDIEKKTIFTHNVNF